MYEWVKKIHMYAGLLTYTAFVVWGVTGIHAVFLPAPGGYTPPEISSEREMPFRSPANLDDKQLAKRIYETADFPLAGGHYNIHRDDDLNLAFFVFTVNGRRDVTYLEEQGIVRIAHRRRGLAGFLSSMHTSHSRRGPPVLASRLWGFYNEFSTYAFLFMTVSGVYMWFVTRPGLRWAQATAAAVVGLSIVLWILNR